MECQLCLGGNKDNALGVVLFVYDIILMSKLTQTTLKELYCISKVLFVWIQSSIIIEQAESDRVSVYRQSHRTPREVRETAVGRLITGV